MATYARKRLFVDAEVQGRFALRAVAYWLGCMTVVMGMAMLGRLLMKPTEPFLYLERIAVGLPGAAGPGDRAGPAGDGLRHYRRHASSGRALLRLPAPCDAWPMERRSSPFASARVTSGRNSPMSSTRWRLWCNPIDRRLKLPHARTLLPLTSTNRRGRNDAGRAACGDAAVTG